jgi:hypothetical protein
MRVHWLAAAVAVFVGMLLGAVLQPQVTGPAQAASTSDIGRYQIVMSPTWHSDQFVLDTATGRLWRCITGEGEDDLLWSPEPYQKITPEFVLALTRADRSTTP